MPGQGNRGGGSQGQPTGPNPYNGPNRGRQTAGGGGGAGQVGNTWSTTSQSTEPLLSRNKMLVMVGMDC